MANTLKVVGTPDANQNEIGILVNLSGDFSLDIDINELEPLLVLTSAVWVGTQGDLVYTNANGDIQTLRNVVGYVPIGATKINATNEDDSITTTAADISYCGGFLSRTTG